MYSGGTAIISALMNGGVQTAQMLLPANPNLKDSDLCGSSALNLAKKGGHLEMATLLENRNISLN
jgi:ankyrin repeat protein